MSMRSKVAEKVRKIAKNAHENAKKEQKLSKNLENF
jgi:hypothetical protein